MKTRILGLILAAATILTPAVAAADPIPITGVELGVGILWEANSTNALNYAQQTPSRVGQVAPYVLLQDATPTSVTLNFSNMAAGLAFFEYRLDFTANGTTAHPVVAGDTIHPGVAVFSGTSVLRTFDFGTYGAFETVEVRLALGAERDWDFNWTAFEVEAVPDGGATLALFGLALGGLGIVRRRFM